MASLLSTSLLLFCLLHLLSLSSQASPAAARPLRSPATLDDDVGVYGNHAVQLLYSRSNFSIIDIVSLLHAPAYSFLAAPIADWWSSTIVTNSSSFTLSTSSPHSSRQVVQGKAGLELTTYGIALTPPSLGTVDIRVVLTTTEGQQLIHMHSSIVGWSTTAPIGQWDWSWSISQQAAGSGDSDADYDDVLIMNESYGELWRDPLQSATDSMYQTYPAASGSFQFLAHYHQLDEAAFPPSHPGLYLATHDPTASLKTFYYIPSAADGTLTLGVTIMLPNGNMPLPQPAVRFPFVLGVFRGDWWDAAQLYRDSFALSAPWTARRLAERDDFPPWFLQTQLWLNTGWQDHDVFNDTQGDPDVVLERVTNIARRFDLPFNATALHWVSCRLRSSMTAAFD